MVTKLSKSKTAKKTTAPLTGSVKDSAQQIWQAGIGAFTKAQAEGTRAIEALIKEGVNMQRKTQSVAEEKLSEASSRMSSMATDLTSKASGQWDKLESIFEDRVAKALNKLGVPSAKDVNALIERINELNKSVQKLSAKAAAPKAAAKATPRAGARKAAKTLEKPVTKARPAARSGGTSKPAARAVRSRKAVPAVQPVTAD